MAEIEQVSDWALAIAAEAAGSKLHHYERMADDNRLAQSIEAHARAIEQHEAFRQEVSDAMLLLQKYLTGSGWGRGDRIDLLEITGGGSVNFHRFIIAKPDPLVEALEEWINSRDLDDAASFRAAIEKRGGKIVWGDK